MTDVTQSEGPMELPPIKIAFLIENNVVEILNTDDRIAAILLSNPVIMDVTDRINNEEEYIMLGSTYNAETDMFEYGEDI
jgi:hypothetical protein